MLKRMLAATLALGLAAGGASAQVSSQEAQARKEAEVARAQAERLAQEARRLTEQMKAQQAEMQKRIEALEKQLQVNREEAESQRKRAVDAFAKARGEMGKAMAEKAAKPGGGKKETYIGLVTDKTPELVAEHLGVKGGLVVAQVLPDSPAAKAGLKQNDILLTMNGNDLSSPEQFKKLVVALKGGTFVQLNLLRGGKKDSLTVELGEREANRLEGLFGAADVERFGKAGEGFGKFEGFGKGGEAFEAGKGFRFKMDGDGKFTPGELFEKKAGEGARIRRRGDAGQSGGSSSDRTTISVQSNDGRITIHGECTQDGKSASFNESGTKEELLKKLDKFPEKIRPQIKDLLNNMEVGPGGSPRRIRVQGKAQANAAEALKEKIAAVRALDDEQLAELKAKGIHVVTDLEKLNGDLKDLDVQVLAATKDALKGLDVFKIEKLEALKELEGLNKLEGLKDLEALKDLDVKVRILDAEGLKDLKDLKTKIPAEIKAEIEKSLRDRGLKDKIKEKVRVERRDSQ